METSADHQAIFEELAVEDDRVAEWRFQQFSSLGFGYEDAQLLSGSDADLHGARTLVAAGCPLHLALRILL